MCSKKFIINACKFTDNHTDVTVVENFLQNWKNAINEHIFIDVWSK